MGELGNTFVVAYLVCVNVLAFALFGVDKARARRGEWRIPEKTLMLVAALGGSLGALAGMQAFRHKTRKPLFRIGVPVLLAVTIAVGAGLALTGCQQRQGELPADFQQATVEYVVDGDTVDVMLDGVEQRVRLIGVDAPESASHDESQNTHEGALATDYLRTLLPQGRVVYLQKDTSETDQYDRLLRYLWLEVPADAHGMQEVSENMVNARLVGAGYAQAKPYAPDTAYADQFDRAEARAVEVGLGVSYLWAE